MEEEILEQEIELENENAEVVAGTFDYEELDNKPQINGVELVGDKSLEDLGIDQNFVKDDNYTHTDNNYTTQEKNKLASLNNYDDTEVKNDISSLKTNKADKSTTYTKSEVDLLIPDVSGFITKTVDDLVNYYKKTETYTKSEVNELIGSVSSINFTVVQTLPTQDISTTTIYLVPNSSSITSNVYDEYIYVNNNWEIIGSTDVDLTGYVTTTELNTALQSYTTTSDLTTLLNGKQNTIDSIHKISADLIDDTSSSNKFFSGNYNDLTNKPTIPDELSDLIDDTTHRLVTDTEKTTWSGKQEALVSGTNIKTINNNSILGSGDLQIGGGKTYKIILDDNDGNFVDYNTTYNKGVFQEIYDNFDSINASDIYIYGSHSLAVYNVNSISKKNFQLRITIDYNFDSTSTYTKYGVNYMLVSRNELYSNFLGGEVGDISKYRTTTYKLSQLGGVLGLDNTTSYTPSGNYNPATKKYVDDLVGDIATTLDTINGEVI